MINGNQLQTITLDKDTYREIGENIKLLLKGKPLIATQRRLLGEFIKRIKGG